MILGLPPIVGERPRVLILGSIPGGRSLETGRYYVGPGNRFWGTMAEILGFPPDLRYEARVRRLKARGIALWDVLHRCAREGSLDARIVTSTEEPNDLAGFFARHPDVDLVALNGRKAAESFRRHVRGNGHVPTSVPLPSTSAANARLSAREVVERWSVLREHLE